MLLRFFRASILLFIMIVGFNAQADTYSVLSVNISEKPLCQQECESEQSPNTFPSDHSYQYALPEPTRYASNGGLTLNDPEPDYQVEIELSIPLSPSFVIGYAVNINHDLYWLTDMSSSRTRISGWKDSNLLYSHRQYPAVITFA
ncbi:hypothetical protein [Moritella sp. 24]|uniref:hypothetical protein n=1 Tax=Moritella sp. 24 TaxID=2746230 RepID=UPI00210823EE|nr:hypothetical protein [Moritella sp. 24]